MRTVNVKQNMIIDKELTGETLCVKISGRLDTTTSPVLEGELASSTDQIKELILDFQELEYLSSAGLRVLLVAQKQMNQQGSMIVKNVNDVIMEVFDITGFSDILTIVNDED